MNVKEIGHEDVDWIQMVQDRIQWWTLVNMVMNLWIPQKVSNFLATDHHEIFNKDTTSLS
jgi:hypothetical protein